MTTQLEKHYLNEIARLQAMNNRYLFYFAGLYDGLGRIYLESNKLPQAKDAFSKAIRIDQSGFNWSMSKQLTSSYEGLARCAELMHDTAQVKRIQSVLAKITTPDRRSSFPLQKFYDLTNAAQKLPPSEAGEAIAKLEEARAILRQFYIFDVVLDAELDVKLAALYSAQGKDKESKLAFEHALGVLDGLEKAGLPQDNFVRLNLVSNYINALNKQGKQNVAIRYAELVTSLKADTERQAASRRAAVSK
jgi:tetratricopeptide (TPR) repeat protein